MVKSTLFEVILGTYEEFLIGYTFNPKSQELTQTFASHSHSSSLRSVAVSYPYLASGGADDRIVIYDLKTRKEHCMLTHHNATVNCLKFTPEHTHLISGSADGILTITRVGNWQVEKIWEKAHKGTAIIDIAVHSSGKLALTLGGDATIRTWNLIKGRQAYAINLNSKYKHAKLMQSISWSPNGSDFVLCGGNTSDIWSIETGGIITKLEHKNKVTHAVFFDVYLLIGFENGELGKFNTDGEKIKVIQAHKSRVKSLDTQNGYIVTCSSDGEIKIFNIEFQEVAKCSTGCRHTCLVIVPNETEEETQNEDVEVILNDVSKKKIKKKAIVEVITEENDDLEHSEPKKKKKKDGFNVDGKKKLKKKKV